MRTVAIGSTQHGKWTYRTVVIYVAQPNKASVMTWRKERVVWEATTAAKIQRLAEQVAREQGLPLTPGIRHNDVVVA